MVGDDLHLARGAFVIHTKAVAAKMKIAHDSVCWGMMASNKTSHKGFWKGNCEGGDGHESFESSIHKAALKKRKDFQALDKSDKAMFSYPFRQPTVE